MNFEPIKKRWDDANAKQQEAARKIDALKTRIASAYQLCRALLAQPPQPDLAKDVGEALHGAPSYLRQRRSEPAAAHRNPAAFGGDDEPVIGPAPRRRHPPAT